MRKQQHETAARAIPRLWGLHATMMASYPVDKNLLVVGWGELGDLSRDGILDSEESFREHFMRTYEGEAPGRIRTDLRQMLDFLFTAKVGDYVVYPYKAEKSRTTLYVGRIAGGYEYDPSVRYGNQRRVEWVGRVDRNDVLPVSRGAVDRPQSFFSVDGVAAQDILSKVGAAEPPVPGDGAKTVERYIVERLLAFTDGYGFQKFVADALAADGYVAKPRDKGADGGVDIEASRADEFIPVRFLVQVKRETGNTGVEELQQLRGIIPEGTLGLFVTLAGYTKAALDFAREHRSLVLMDGEAFARMVAKVHRGMTKENQHLLALDGWEARTSAHITP